MIEAIKDVLERSLNLVLELSHLKVIQSQVRTLEFGISRNFHLEIFFPKFSTRNFRVKN